MHMVYRDTMPAGDGDEGAVAAEVKQNGHADSIGTSEDDNSKNAEKPAEQPAKDDSEEAEKEISEAPAEEPVVENGRSSPEQPSAPVAAPAAPPEQPSQAGQQAQVAVIRKRSSEAAAADDSAAKRPRSEAGERPTPLTPDISCLRTVELIESSLHKLKREVKAIDLLARQKEKEWDNLLKLRKAKEETFQRLRRKREVLLMQQGDETGGRGGSATATAAASTAVSAASLAQAQAHLQQKQKQRAAAAAALAAAQPGLGLRPIRPALGTPFAASAAGRIGMGPQGPTISVQHLIERHHASDYRRRPDGAVPLPASSPAAAAGPQDPQYREMMAQIAKLSNSAAAAAASSAEVTIYQKGGSTDATASGQPQSSLAKLLMESKMKQVEPTVLNEMLKQPQSAVRAAPVAAGPRVSVPSPAAQQSPRQQQQQQQQPPSASAEDVPFCQGCRQRQAQFVCAGCGHQWYCSRECQVEAWDSHADDCSG